LRTGECIQRQAYSRSNTVAFYFGIIQGLKDYLKIHLVNTNKTILTLMNFKEILEKLPANQFLRVHKSFIVNINSIKKVQRNRIIINDIRIPIGESHRAEFYSVLGLK
jgi:DNA-binding LytR/AlgR family response regulator